MLLYLVSTAPEEAAKAEVAAALLEEDLSHGQSYGDVRLVNPFRRQPRR